MRSPAFLQMGLGRLIDLPVAQDSLNAFVHIAQMRPARLRASDGMSGEPCPDMAIISMVIMSPDSRPRLLTKSNAGQLF